MPSPKNELNEFLEEHNEPKFTYASLAGQYIELCPNGVSR